MQCLTNYRKNRSNNGLKSHFKHPQVLLNNSIESAKKDIIKC